MLRISVLELTGLAGIPVHRTSATRWLVRYGVPIETDDEDGRRPQYVQLSDLPDEVRFAWLERDCAQNGLQGGDYDDAAHAAFLTAPAKLRAEAERKASIARFALYMRPHLSRDELVARVSERFPGKGTSKSALKTLLRAVEGVDPINFAPALLRDQKGGAPKAKMTEDAWRLFLSIIEGAAPDFPLKSAWRDVRDLSKAEGWDWPAYITTYRRWRNLTEAQRLVLRHGEAEATKRLTQPVRRDKTSIKPLEVVSLDGRVQDYWVTMPDGKVQRPVMLTLVDVASNYILGFELVASENAAATVRLIKKVVVEHGIFDRLYTDNGAAFAGHLVAGGAVHRFRNAGGAARGIRPPGICQHLDIKLQFALPANAKAKIAERTFAAISRAIDDRPEFAGAHAGHNPGAAPKRDTKPVDFTTAMAVLEREVARHNAETGRRSQGARGRSYEAVFRDGLKDRLPRVATARQLWLAGLIYSAVAVDRNGQMQRNGWTYGGPDTMHALLPYHQPGHGIRVLLGVDPSDFGADAIAFTEDGDLICEAITAVQAGDYNDQDGAREAARLRKVTRDAVKRAAEANDTLSDHELAAAMARLPVPSKHSQPGDVGHVVAPRFGGPVSSGTASPGPANPTTIPEEFFRNMDTELAKLRAQSGK